MWNIGHILAAFAITISGVGGAAVLEDADMTSWTSASEETDRMDKKIDRIEIKLEIVDSCLEWENCTVDEDWLLNKSQHLNDRLDMIETCQDDRDNCTKPSKEERKAAKEARKAAWQELSDEEKLDLLENKLLRKKALIEACLENPDCDVDEDRLLKALDRIDKALDKIEDGELPEKPGKRRAKGMKRGHSDRADL